MELLLPTEIFNALSHCSTFRTLEQHAEFLMKSGMADPNRAAALSRILSDVAKGGLMLSAGEIGRRIEPGSVTEQPLASAVAAVITCDRPAALERLLESIREVSVNGPIASCVVMDDSRSIEHSARNRSISKNKGIPVRYFGAKEARELLHGLLSELPEHERGIRFLLDRERWARFESFGLARNFCQLLSINEPLVVFDDDTLCEARHAPQVETGLEISNRPREAEFFKSHEEWRRRLAPMDFDPVSGHLQCLGQSFSSASLRLSRNLTVDAFRHASPAFAASLRADSPVLITECGSLGDPGTAHNRWLPLVPPATRERLARTEGALESAQTRRCCWLGRTRPVIHPHAKISQVTGFDNRRFLPPYFPVMRGEDRLFGEAVGALYPHGVTLEYPWSVPHLPIPERGWPDKAADFSLRTVFPGRLMHLVIHRAAESQSINLRDRLDTLAAGFADLAGSPDRAVMNRFAEDWHGFRAAQLRQLQKARRESSGLPETWRNYLEQAFRQIEASRPTPFEPEALEPGLGGYAGRELLDFWRSAWADYGRALRAWPDIREAAARLTAGDES